jgi:hypothetical protein
VWWAPPPQGHVDTVTVWWAQFPEFSDVDKQTGDRMSA